MNPSGAFFITVICLVGITAAVITGVDHLASNRGDRIATAVESALGKAYICGRESVGADQLLAVSVPANECEAARKMADKWIAAK